MVVCKFPFSMGNVLPMLNWFRRILLNLLVVTGACQETFPVNTYTTGDMYFKKIATSQFKALVLKLKKPNQHPTQRVWETHFVKPTKRKIDVYTLELPKLQWMKIRIVSPMPQCSKYLFRRYIFRPLKPAQNTLSEGSWSTRDEKLGCGFFSSQPLVESFVMEGN